MAAYQNDVHGSIILGTGSATGAQNGSSQAPIRSHSTNMLTGLIPITAAQSKMANNVAYVPSNCVIVNGAGIVQSNVVTTQYQNTVYQPPYTTMMQRVYSSPVLMTSQQQQTTGYIVTANQNSQPTTIYESDEMVDQNSASGSLSLNIPVHEEPVYQTAEATPAPESIEVVEPATTSTAEEEPEEGEIDIQIRNVVCNFTLPLHIDLHRVALNSGNVTFDRGRGVLLKQKRDPSCFVKVYSSGKVYIVGCRSESECKRAARGVARMVQKRMGKTADLVRIRNYKICNVLATCKMPFGIKIEELAKKYPQSTQYEPELKVGLDWKCTNPKATLRIHTTGSITVLGAVSENDVMRAIEIMYPIVREFRCAYRSRDAAASRKRKQLKRSSSEEDLLLDVKRRPAAPKQPPPDAFGQRNGANSGAVGNRIYFSDEDDEFDDGD